ncbi:hypothetical protein CRYUN_Cryun04dG0081900 [Craigia yunnanensis]
MTTEQEQDASSAALMFNGNEKDIDIIATYSDVSGTIRTSRVKMKDLSASWVLENPLNRDPDKQKGSQVLKLKDSYQASTAFEENVEHLIDDNQFQEAEIQNHLRASWSPVKFKRQLLRDQIIMAKAYANIAKSKNQSILYNSLLKHVGESQRVIGDANSDAELHPSSLDHAKTMGHALSIAKDELYDCRTLAAKTVPKPLHCLPLQLAADYFIHGYQNKKDLNKEKLEDPSLYHYAIFSDNVLATSVVVNSTVLHANEPEKHVFHVVTDKVNFAAIKMWFVLNAPEKATVQVENIDDFKWLNSSYCSVLRQLESAKINEYS